MTSFCKITNPSHSWQRLITECLGDQPLYQRQGNHQRNIQDNKSDTETNTSDNNVYWADGLDGLSAPTSYPSPWQYHTALAIGATVVCSAGAMMQHTETGFWQQPDDTSANTTNTASAKQAEAVTDGKVSTPPIVSPQAVSNVSFSAGSSDSTCKDTTCKGLEFIDQQVPQLQEEVRQLRSEMQLFQAKHTTQNLQTHRTVLAYRSSDLGKRQAELMVRSQQLNQKLSNLTTVLALQPEDVSQMSELLKTDAKYQSQLQQLQGLENDIATEFSNPDLDNTQLGELYAAYYHIESQLRYTAQVVLADYIYAASLESSDPLWQEATYEASLQELMDVSHQQQMLAMEQSTLNQIATRLTERRTELASLLRQYAAMQQELDGHNQVLQQYVAKRQALKSELT